MHIEFAEIDPQVALAVQSRLNLGSEEDTPVVPWQRSRRRGRRRRSVRIASLMTLSLVVPPILGFVLGGLISAGGSEAYPMAYFMWFFTWILGTTLGVWRTYCYSQKRLPKSALTLGDMVSVFPQLKLTRAEKVYCDTLTLLARTQTDIETETTMRTTLRQLNSLMDRSRELEARRLSLLPLLGSNIQSQLDLEVRELERRIEQTEDIIARQSLQHSLKMCRTRLENTKAFSKSLERLEAQQEAIVQTLSSAHSALARTQLAPDMQSPLAAQEIAETVAQMNQQTYAVEKAVEEVMLLHG